LSNQKTAIQGEKRLESPLQRIRSIADYQFGQGVGNILFPENVAIEYSHSTGRIRYISLRGERLATLRPTDGMLSISISAARVIAEKASSAQCFVTVRQDVAEFVEKGGDVFAVHVVKADSDIHAKEEVVVKDEKGRILAVGRAFLSAAEMLAFKTGVAVKVRHGNI
jgi:predicted RNA-binding protein (TIGR00451 family)